MTHRIAICIVTFKRPRLLARTLESLKTITLPPDSDITLIVIDNDAHKSASTTVSAMSTLMPFAVEYIVEEKRGIPYARNAALEAAKDYDYIAFIDDDDSAEQQWLAALCETAERFDADVVKGQIAYTFPEGKSYLGKLDIFTPSRLATGSPLDSAWTNNVLFRTRIYKETGLRFDARFSNTGGSDNHFFRAAKNNDATIVMCQEAVVRTHVPQERTTLQWLAKRHMRVGANLTIADTKIHGFTYAAHHVALSLTDSAKYFFRLLPGVVSGENPVIYPVMVLYFILGRLLGLFYISPREYK